MKSIVRRDTGESYNEYLERLAEAEGVNVKDAAALRRMDRKRKKKTSNEDWESPSDGDAEITKLKDGRTAGVQSGECGGYGDRSDRRRHHTWRRRRRHGSGGSDGDSRRCGGGRAWYGPAGGRQI